VLRKIEAIRGLRLKRGTCHQIQRGHTIELGLNGEDREGGGGGAGVQPGGELWGDLFSCRTCSHRAGGNRASMVRGGIPNERD